MLSHNRSQLVYNDSNTHRDTLSPDHAPSPIHIIPAAITRLV